MYSQQETYEFFLKLTMRWEDIQGQRPDLFKSIINAPSINMQRYSSYAQAILDDHMSNLAYAATLYKGVVHDGVSLKRSDEEALEKIMHTEGITALTQSQHRAEYGFSFVDHAVRMYRKMPPPLYLDNKEVAGITRSIEHIISLNVIENN